MFRVGRCHKANSAIASSAIGANRKQTHLAAEL